MKLEGSEEQLSTGFVEKDDTSDDRANSGDRSSKLHRAVEDGKLQDVQELVEQNPAALNEQDEYVSGWLSLQGFF